MIEATPLHLAELPTVPGVYFFEGATGETLYIGKSVNLRERVRSYFRKHGGHSRRTERLKNEVVRIRIQPTGNELEALLLESQLIKQHQPPYNVRGRRYEHYPFVKITNEPYPRLLVTRFLEDDGAQYFGPFHSANRLTETLEALQALMGWRRCAQMEAAPCLHAQIGRCLAPCSGEADAPYAAMISQVGALFRGDAGPVLGDLRAQMREASEALEFERAARLRDRLAPLTKLVERQERLRGALSELDTVTVVPGYSEDLQPTVNFLAIRAARRVGTFTLRAEHVATSPERRKHLKQLERFLTERFVLVPPPPTRISAVELDEVQIVGSWLFRQRLKPGYFSIHAGLQAETARAAMAFAVGLLRS
jgi:excinuclease UvrABC nuclease subunit